MSIDPSARPPAPAWARWLAVLGIAASIVSSAIALILNWELGTGLTWEFVSDATYVSNSVFTALIALPICLRQSRNPIGWLIMLAAVSLGLQAVLDAYLIYAFDLHSGQLPGVRLAALLVTWLWAVPFAIVPNAIMLFPTGRFLTPRWRWVSLATVVWFLAVVLGALFADPILVGDSGQYAISNPIGFWEIPEDLFFGLMFPALLLLFALSVLSLYLRWRRADQILRQQIKYLIAAMILIVVALLGSFVTDSVVFGIIINVTFLTIPAAIALAILRYRLYDIDFILRRTTSYAILTGLLALVYLGSVVVLQRLLSPLTGESTIAVVLSTLLIAALFLPLRRRIQNAIDRRFFRQKYDAERVMAEFAATVRDETDLDSLTAELVRVIQETMQPESVSVWLRPMGAEQGTSVEIVPARSMPGTS